MKGSNILTVIFILCLFNQCDKFLEENPPHFISTSNFYKTEVDARTATDAIYEALHNGNSSSIYGRWWTGIDIGTDDITSRVNRTNYNNWLGHTLNPADVWIESYGPYQNLWTGIGRANDVLTNIPNITMDEVKKNAMIGEARALRAMIYYNLVRAWGDMPIILNSVSSAEDFALPRSSIDEVYEQVIIPDLKFAEEHCADELHTGRVTKWTAKIILAEVYLTRAGWRRTSQGQFVQGDPMSWALARDKAKEIIDQSPHKLITQAYENGAHKTMACAVPWLESFPFSEESMFELASANIAGYGSWLTRDCSPNANGTQYWGAPANKPLEGEGVNRTVAQMRFPGNPLSVGMFIPTPDLAENFEEGDERREAFLMTKYTTPEGDTYLCQPTIRKYVDIDYFLGKENTSFLNTNRNWILYRLADALLIYAEAQNESDGSPSASAFDAINQIRNRAGLANLEPDLSQEEFRLAVWKERRSELCGEIKRRFDLIRTNRLKTETEQIRIMWGADLGAINDYVQANPLYAQSPWPDNEWLLPIPQSEMDLNAKFGWAQNEGY